ncbi:hypothetical protein ACFPVY_17060 [Flavobacterium qiangtangense]|uniref:Uncharacterized protein n=1 Tax=Flavobacterium qiangtangense TaxID=1442595 RepID=A0ABW1PU38_9FLAO
MKLEIKWDTFSDKIKSFVDEANEISKTEREIKNEADLSIVKEKIEGWNKQCYDYLKSSFDGENNDFAIGFYNAKELRYNLGQKEDVPKKIKNVFADFNEKKNTLTYLLRTLSVCDAIIRTDEINIKERENFTTGETLDLILEKLFDLYDNYFHSIEMILEGNGIVQKRHGEDRELIKILENRGLVNVMAARHITAQLTTNGKIYVEERRKVKSSDYSRISDSKNEINHKIDEIIQELNKLGLGQEIIFDELSEMKDLYERLDKKNWGQLLKGKLIDLGLSQAVSIEVLNLIYKELTKEVLKLI